jgi:hypothetical protein
MITVVEKVPGTDSLEAIPFPHSIICTFILGIISGHDHPSRERCPCESSYPSLDKNLRFSGIDFPFPCAFYREVKAHQGKIPAKA